MPSLRSSMIADRRQRIVSGERHPVGLAKWLAVAQHAVVPWCRLNGEADSFEPSNELANVLSHVGESSRSAGFGCSVVPGRRGQWPP